MPYALPVRQTQFLTVVSVEEAKRRFAEALPPAIARTEDVALDAALGRVLAADVHAPGDVPSFDRADLDGFALRARDVFGSTDERPVRLALGGPPLTPGNAPAGPLASLTAVPISTGAMVPRGADAVVGIEHTDLDGSHVLIRRPVVPGAAVTAAGSDMVRGETILFAGSRLTSRETGTIAACGLSSVRCVARPFVAVISTGGELRAPGVPLGAGLVHDANGTMLSDAIRETGGVPLPIERVTDDAPLIRAALLRALDAADVVVISGGTSKGRGDLVPDVVNQMGPPGLVVHGVDLKPGKPLGLAVCRGKPVVLLPGFPTSAVFTFHEVVAPLIRALAGRRDDGEGVIRARVPRRITAERGRTEYLLVALIESDARADARACFTAYPMGKGSGSVTAFARADGFIRIPGDVEFLEAGAEVDVVPLGRALRPADLVLIGSHCVGLDAILSRVAQGGLAIKSLFVGSTVGLEAARRGECDVAPVHLLDEATGTYNVPFLTSDLLLVPGYRRRQVLAFRTGDTRFEGRPLAAAVAAALADPDCRLVNRQRGSGTRALVDRLLGQATPPGFESAVRSHAAVAAAIAQRRADFGVCVEGVARDAGLGGTLVAEEQYDFVVPRSRAARAPVLAFRRALDDPSTLAALARLGFLRP